MTYKAQYIDLGLKEYKEVWKFQESSHEEIVHAKNKGELRQGKLIFCEHPHVYTLGKSGQQNNLLINDEFLKKINATYYQSNRGGDITYHGPGQIVGYPIFDLETLNMGVKEYISNMEDAIINTLADYGISASSMDGATGVWIDIGTPAVRKICAFGVRVSKAVTMHGFALNVNTQLDYFSYINPCGFTDRGVSSMEKETAGKIDMQEVKDKLLNNFISIFKLAM